MILISLFTKAYVIGFGRDQKKMQNALKYEFAALGEVPQLTTPSLSRGLVLLVFGHFTGCYNSLAVSFFFFLFIADEVADCG